MSSLPRAQRCLRIQLWSSNYDPEPTGIAPISRVWAQAMMERGHDIEVVAAHPHYPTPAWGRRLRPYRETRDGVRVLRLPLWSGRETGAQRVRQELTFVAALTAGAVGLGSPDVVVAVSPSFPALAPAMMNARIRRIPWVLWLQDILPDGAAATGILDESSPVVRAARSFERAAYRSASRIVVISGTFEENLRRKGVSQRKLVRIYNPASRPVVERPRAPENAEPRRILTMGNIGFSQGLAEIVRAFEAHEGLARRGARFVMAGDGVAGDAVRAAIRTDRVEVTGILDDSQLEDQLRRASVAVVSQRYDGAEFNVPSKLMNFMGYGHAVVASVGPVSEVATILEASGGGWVTNSVDPTQCMARLHEVLDQPQEIVRRGRLGLDFARANFTPEHIAYRFETVLHDVLGRR
jgi:colanic acid biosynthesis glycosyl transferase WcaI